MGDVIAIVSREGSSPNRKMLLGYVGDDRDVVLITPTRLIHSRHSDETMLSYAGSGAAALLLLGRVLRESLRRREAHRDVLDDDLSLTVITGETKSRIRGETDTSQSSRARELREVRADGADGSGEIDELLWWTLFTDALEHFDPNDTRLLQFADELLTSIEGVEGQADRQGVSSGARVLEHIEELRHTGFSSFQTVHEKKEGRQMFKKLIRSSIHMSSKIAGLTALRLCNELVSPPITPQEIKMLSILYGPCRELGGVSIDMFGRRFRAIRPHVSALYEGCAQNDEKAIGEATGQLASTYMLSAIYLGRRREADAEVKRLVRRRERGVAELSVDPSPSGDDQAFNAIGRKAAPEKEPDLLAELVKLMPDSRFRQCLAEKLRPQTLKRLEALVECEMDIARAARSLRISPRKLNDTVRKNLMLQVPAAYRAYSGEEA